MDLVKRFSTTILAKVLSKQKVIIIGAGLSGSLLAIYLAKRGIESEIYEARGDMQNAPNLKPKL